MRQNDVLEEPRLVLAIYEIQSNSETFFLFQFLELLVFVTSNDMKRGNRYDEVLLVTAL